MKIALVHDYLSQDGGAEKVLEKMHEIWPEAPIFVLFYDKEKVPYFKNADVRQSFLAKMPGIKNHYQWYLLLMPFATERHDLHEYDLIISSSSAFSKGVITSPDSLHICYCHTPTRYLWTDTHQYISELKYPWIVKKIIPFFLHRLRQWDLLSVGRVDRFIANSKTVQKRILKYYHRESEVLYPPIDEDKSFIAPEIGDYFLSGGRMVSYKRFDLLIQAFNRSGKKLYLFGTGPEEKQLKKKAKSNITFLGKVSDEEKWSLMARALAFLHPQVEDSGITPVESMASGRPVIAYGEGGVLETVVEGKTGVFFYEQSWEAIYETIRRFNPSEWDSSLIRAHAERFFSDIFKKNLRDSVEKAYSDFLKERFKRNENGPDIII